MSEIILDTETTGLSPLEGDRIIEIACIETKGLIPTKKRFHILLNPKRPYYSQCSFCFRFFKPRT